MNFFSFAYSLFNAIAAVPKILGYVEAFAAGVTQWYAERQTNETLKQIADAAAFAARAKTQEERYEAVNRWKSALSRSRSV